MLVLHSLFSVSQPLLKILALNYHFLFQLLLNIFNLLLLVFKISLNLDIRAVLTAATSFWCVLNLFHVLSHLVDPIFLFLVLLFFNSLSSGLLSINCRAQTHVLQLLLLLNTFLLLLSLISFWICGSKLHYSKYLRLKKEVLYSICIELVPIIVHSIVIFYCLL